MPFVASLLLPLALQGISLGGGHGDEARQAPERRATASISDRGADWLGLEALRRAEPAEQVRVEGRVILRISPRPAPSNDDLLRELLPDNRPEPFVRMVERPAGRCVAMRDIAGVSDRGNRLILFLRDNRILMAELEKACSPRDFYRGFYLERSEDGKMCAQRDTLMSRAGAKCALKGLTELVPVGLR